MSTKIVVEVSGGVVTGVYCDDGEAEVYIVDYDNEGAGGGFVEEREMRETGKALIEQLNRVWC